MLKNLQIYSCKSDLHIEFTVIDSGICVWRTPKAELYGKLAHAWC